MTDKMTLSKFKEAIEEWGERWEIDTEIKIRGPWIEIYTSVPYEIPNLIATVHNEKLCVFDLAYTETMDLNDMQRRTLFDIIIRYANTWPALRKDKEKKYCLKHRFIKSFNRETYLIGGPDHFWLSIDDKRANEEMRFTLNEIEEIKVIYHTDLGDFELIEVEDD